MLWGDDIVFMEKDNNMKFSDFEDIQQDEWSLERPTFPTPTGGTLTVVGWSGKLYSNKLYLVQCSECMKDEELHGDGAYQTTKANIIRGRVPCGCSRFPTWKEWQYKIRVGRVAKEKGYDFLGWDEEFKDTHKTKAVLTCHKHGEFKTPIGYILQGRGCRQCVWENSASVLSKNQEDVIRDFLEIHGDRYDYSLVAYKAAKTKVKIICPTHGVFMQTPKSHLVGKGCPKCAGHSQQQAYINIVNDENLPVAIKLGISVNSNNRIKWQNYKNLFQMENVGIWNFEKVEDCKRAESECKRKLQCGILSARELKDGWSETTHLQNLEKVIEIYEKWGGIREESDE